MRRRTPRAWPVLPLYRFPELRQLEPWQRSRVVRAAGAMADAEFVVQAAWFLSIALLVALVLFARPWLDAWTTVLAVLAFGVPYLLIRRARVRHHVREILRTGLPPEADNA